DCSKIVTMAKQTSTRVVEMLIARRLITFRFMLTLR
ncbi:MAG: hypothetical protein ACJAYO_001557, partial [Thalassolituus oleivorans]